MSPTDAPASVGLADRSSVKERTFAWSGDAPDDRMLWFVDGLRRAMVKEGYEELPAPGPEVQVVLHHLDPENARPYRRKSAPTFVVALAPMASPPDDVLRAGYPLLVRGLANLCVMMSARPSDGATVVDFVTLEQGTYAIEHRGDDRTFFTEVFERIEPLASSRLVIANEFRADLPVELCGGDEQTRQIRRAGERLDALDLLPRRSRSRRSCRRATSGT